MACARALRLLLATFAMASPAIAQAPSTPSDARMPGSVIIFPEFRTGTITIEGSEAPATDIEVSVVCPPGIVCAEHQQIKIRFHWVCPAEPAFSSKLICKENSFDVFTAVNSKLVFRLGATTATGESTISVPQPPCPMGYVIGWVVDPANDQPVKFDGLIGSAVIRKSGPASLRYSAFPIGADPALATFPASGSGITTGTDPLTATPTLIFDGGAGHYQSPVSQPAATSPFVTGPPSSADLPLILLTLDVRSNQPNYPVVAELDAAAGQEVLWSLTREFVCWTELTRSTIRQNPALRSAGFRKGFVLSGRGVKVPFMGISDSPGAVALLALVGGSQLRETGSANPAYGIAVEGKDRLTPKAIFVPF